MLLFVKETQISAISNTGWSTRLHVVNKILFHYFLGATYTANLGRDIQIL